MQHPKEIIDKAIVEQIRQHTFETEATKSLPPAILKIIYEQHWFQLLIPKACGGTELNLPQTVQLFEALAWAEANTGWCVNLGAGANMFCGYLDTATAKSIFNSPEVCCAGSGAISGKAYKTDGGYFLSGRWKYASGANHATHFTANAYLLDEQGNNIVENGNPVFRSFIIPAANIINHKNWNALGLKGTSSNDFEARDVFVQESHTFTLLKPSPFAQGSLYKFPFGLLAVVNMTCMITGIAYRFIDLYNELAQQKKPLHGDVLLKDNPIAREISGNAIDHFMDTREKMYGALQQVWDIYEQGNEADTNAQEQLTLASINAAQASREVMNKLYPLCGMNILDERNEINKVWRDAMTASQHYLLSPLYK